VGVTGDAGADPPPSPPLILFAEDETPIRDMLALALKLSGYRVIPCADGQEAIEALAAEPGVDLVLVDLRMPRVAGIEVIRHIRAQASLANLPVIAMSAYSDDLQQREVAAAGANSFLPKPFTVQELLTSIATYVGRP
jgi:CheY-like chemotaxis protein